MPVRRIALLSALLAVLVAVPAGAQDPAPAPVPTIAQGVTAGGVDLSGLTVEQATVKLQTELSPALGRDLILGVAGVPWKLTMTEAKLRFDPRKTSQAALAAKPGTTAVPLAITHAKLAVDAFVRKIAAKVYRAPRNATVTLGLRKMKLRRARHGRALATTAAVKLVNDTLDAGATRVLHQRLSQLSPKVNANDLRKQYGTIVTIDKAHFTLRLFKELKFRKSYKVAVGQPAYPTPEGNFHITDKQVDPVWSVPNSPWAGELGGTTVAGGSAANPLKARWMGITDGVGIHGTGQDYSIGSAASHGCIRMHVWDVKDLYPRVPVGATVIIRHG